MFPAEIVEKKAEIHHVKVHYIGYGNNFDEWKDESKIKTLDLDVEQTGKEESQFQSSVEY